MTPLLGEGVIFDMLRQALWAALQISAPILGVALITGLIIGLLQALTTIQEMTLTFVPKLAAILLCFWTTMSFMTRSLVDFFRDILIPLVIKA